jgi:hypothetical protein
MSQINESPLSEEPGNGEERRDYEVGYKNPPRETQFQKGQSGNPNGRPKGINNFKTDLAAELNERVRITEGGEAKLLTKQQALIKRTMDKAFKGDMRAIEVIVKWRGVYLEEDASEVEVAPLSLNDQAILARARATWVKGQHAQHEQGDDS